MPELNDKWLKSLKKYKEKYKEHKYKEFQKLYIVLDDPQESKRTSAS